VSDGFESRWGYTKNPVVAGSSVQKMQALVQALDVALLAY
jgi:hypothetical protein